MGTAFAYLVLVIVGMRASNIAAIQETWRALEIIGWYSIVPLALCALATGVAVAALSPWGLFQHGWVALSLVLTTLATVVLVTHMPAVSSVVASLAISDSVDALRGRLAGEFLQAGGGLLLLLGIELLNV